MLFAVLYRSRESVTEETQERSLELFKTWQPPFEFKAHWTRCDGDGGVSIVETDSAEAVLEGISPWLPFLSFEVTPVVEIADAVPVWDRTYAWRRSVG